MFGSKGNIDNQICTEKNWMTNSFNNTDSINSYYPSYKTYLNNPQYKMFALINNDNPADYLLTQTII